MRFRHYACLAAGLLLAACAGRERPTLTLSNYDALPGWAADDHAAGLDAFRGSCTALLKLPPEKQVGMDAFQAPAFTWQEICQAAEGVAPENARAFFEAQFTPFSVSSARKGEVGLFTGYYEPVLRGSRKRHGPYQWPVYALPDDVQKGEPYFTREAIDQGALAGRHLEIAWVDDRAALFFMHIQGSGRIALDSGEHIRVNFAGKNNQPYVALGRVLIDAGELNKDDVNMFSLREWLHTHPGQAPDMMWKNPSYVFFKEMPSSGEPPGAEGVALMPMRSLAIDSHLYPYGLPFYLNAELPGGQPLSRLMIAQDTGGAIRGVVRGDVYFGGGAAAEQLAAYMKAEGQFTALVPNAIAATLH